MFRGLLSTFITQSFKISAESNITTASEVVMFRELRPNIMEFLLNYTDSAIASIVLYIICGHSNDFCIM